MLRKSENLGQALKQLVMLQQKTAIQDIITLSIAFGFESLKSDHGFFIEILKIGMPIVIQKRHKY